MQTLHALWFRGTASGVRASRLQHPTQSLTVRPQADYLIFLGLSSLTYQMRVRIFPNTKHWDNGRVHVYERLICKEKTSMCEVSVTRED